MGSKPGSKPTVREVCSVGFLKDTRYKRVSECVRVSERERESKQREKVDLELVEMRECERKWERVRVRERERKKGE